MCLLFAASWCFHGVFTSLPCRRSRRVLFLTRFLPCRRSRRVLFLTRFCFFLSLPCRRSRRVLYLTRFFLSFFLLYPAGAAAGYCIWLVSFFLSLPCRRSRRVLYLTRFFLYPAGAAAGYCIWLVSLYRRMQCACILFLLNSSVNPRVSTMLSNVSPKCMNLFYSNLVTMTNDLAHRCPKTFDPVKGHSRSQGSNIYISLKNFSTQLGYVVWSHDSCTW